MQIKKLWMMAIPTLALGLAACGGGRPAEDPGRGTNTLLVDARVDNEGGNTFFDVNVQRNGVDVNDAVVTFESDLGDYTVALDANQAGDYAGGQPGWAENYRVRVVAGDDWLSASSPSPDAAILTSPNPTMAFDPRLATNGLIDVRWSGVSGKSIRVQTKGQFSWSGPDEGSIQIPATDFTDVSDTIDLRRTNSVLMAGGIVGSELRVRVETQTDVIVVNPF